MDLPPRPANVGILAMDVYFPTTYVNQTELGMRLNYFSRIPSGNLLLAAGRCLCFVPRLISVADGLRALCSCFLCRLGWGEGVDSVHTSSPPRFTLTLTENGGKDEEQFGVGRLHVFVVFCGCLLDENPTVASLFFSVSILSTVCRDTFSKNHLMVPELASIQLDSGKRTWLFVEIERIQSRFV